MRKIIMILLLVVFIFCFLSGCGCNHEWKDATCISPAVCSICGNTKGDVVEHDFDDATCILPKTCSVCHTTVGEMLGHEWIDATYDKPKTCARCGETYAEPRKMSDNCDAVLSTGKTDNGDIYELVANEIEDYNGTIIEIGVIKNNEWFIEPTTESPFINKNGFLVCCNRSVSKHNANKGVSCSNIDYIGNNCFCFEDGPGLGDKDLIIWNMKTNDVYRKTNRQLVRNRSMKSETNYYIVEVTHGDGYADAYFINTNNMEEQLLQDPISLAASKSRYTYDIDYIPYSDGLYGIEDYYINGKDCGKIGFYDMKGNLIVDLSVYDLDTGYDFSFADGECTLQIYNDQGSIYEITIDKKGNVLESNRIG